MDEWIEFVINREPDFDIIYDNIYFFHFNEEDYIEDDTND